jgi:hypothetical protein
MTYFQVVCWKCHKGNVTLMKCENGLDYVCQKCSFEVGREGPDIANQSRLMRKTRKEQAIDSQLYNQFLPVKHVDLKQSKMLANIQKMEQALGL